jgi:hypothetical protein
MLPSDFDRLVARASNPRLIPGIYNYCDRWCERCRFTDRCLQFLEDQEAEPPSADAESLAGRVRESLARRLGTITEIARRQHIDLQTLGAPSSDAAETRERYTQDPLVMSARQYGDLAWRLARALGPIVAARGDPAVGGAVDVIDWFSSMIGAKVSRAVSGVAFARESGDPADDRVQRDFNGSAKIALLGIAESRRAWTVLMAEGKATANGVPAQAVRMLDELDAALRARFPHAMAFVRPGFDEANGADGRRRS